LSSFSPAWTLCSTPPNAHSWWSSYLSSVLSYRF
jgi:hypothetical protein